MRRWAPALLLAASVLRAGEPARGQDDPWVLLVDTGSAMLAFSADGKRLAEVPEGGIPRRDAWNRAASPDGKRVAFTRSVAGKTKYGDLEMFVSDADGGNETRLTDDDRNEVCLRWLPDGKRIAYLSGKDGSDWQLWTVGADGKAARKVAGAGGGGGIDVSRDGRIAFMDMVRGADGSQMWCLAVAEGDGIREIARVSPTSICSYGFAWSPDGKRLAHGYNGSVSVTDPATGKTEGYQLEEHRVAEAVIRWRPDGKGLACSFGMMAMPKGAIHLIPLDGGDPRAIAFPGEAVGFTFDWLPAK